MTADEKLIDNALRSYLLMGRMIRYGGGSKHFTWATEALAAWERMQEAKKPKQLKLGG